MRLSKLFLACTIVCAVASCSKVNTTDEIVRYDSIESHTIPIEKIVEMLPAYFDGINTKSITSDNIRNIFVVKNPYMTKSNTSDTLLYVINLKNDEGFIVMSADDRIPETMLYMAESGNASEGSFTYNDSLGTPYLDLDEVDFYDEENDDYLIGGDPDAVENYLLQCVVDYAAQLASTEMPSTDYDKNPFKDADGDRWLERENYFRDTVIDVTPFIKTRWGQLSPYNNLVPKGRYTGCVVNAIGQIMAYEKFPANFNIGDKYIDWDILTENTFISEDDSVAVDMVSRLLRHIQIECDSWIFCKGTFTFPKKAESFLTSIGFLNVTRIQDYDKNIIRNTIFKEHPVFLAGADGYVFGAINTCHAWLVDGIKSIYEEFDLCYNDNGEFYTHQKNLLWDHVHCVWGTSSSWVINGAFEREDGTIYKNWKRMITYDL